MFVRQLWLLAAAVAFILLFALPTSAEPILNEYDAAGRLTLENVGTVWVTYSYDANGSLLGRDACEGDCYIDDTCHSTDGANPADACQVCDPATDRRGWTSLTPCMPGEDMGGGDDMGTTPDMGGTPDGGPGMGGDAGGDGSDSGGTPGPDGGGDTGEDGGCKCTSAGGPTDASFLLVFAAFVMARRTRRRWRRLAAAATVVLVALPGSAFASTVCLDGTCDYTSIGEAITNATSGETISIKPDTYRESNLGARQGLTITSTNPSGAGSVTIDAEGAGPVFDNGAGMTFRGIRFINGHNTNHGGAIHVQGPYVIVENCVFENNTTDLAGGAIGSGVGQFGVLASNTVFRNNSAEAGGAIGGPVGDLVLRDVVFEGNTANGGGVVPGGAVAVGGGSRVDMKRVIVRGNSATGSFWGRGGGLYLNADYITLEDVTVTGNTANNGGTNPGEGGGIFVGGPNPRWVRFVNVGVTGNTAGRGGGIYLGGVDATFVGGDISTNVADVDTGGGIYCGPAGNIVGFAATIGNNTQDDLGGNCVDCMAGDTQMCDSGRPGVCADGNQGCTAAGLWEICTSNVQMPPKHETMCMNGLDDDCDNAPDDQDYDCIYGWPGTRGDRGGSGEKGDPINTFTGEFFTRLDPDLVVKGPLPMVFTRHYASGLEALGRSGKLGRNWRHSFDWSRANTSGTDNTITAPDGRQIQFRQVNFVWEQQAPLEVPYRYFDTSFGRTLYDPLTDLWYAFNNTAVTRIWDRYGNALVLTYAGTNLATVSDGTNTLTFSHDASNLLTSVSDGARTVSFVQTAGDLTTVTDVFGQDTSYTYAAGGLLTSLTTTGGTALTHTWHPDGRVATQTDAFGNVTSFAYDDTNVMTTVTDPAGGVEIHTHDLAGRLVGVDKPSGSSTAIEYDARGRRTMALGGVGASIERTYDPKSGLVTSSALPDGRMITYDLVERFEGVHLVKEIGAVHYPDGTTESFAYDHFGNVTEFMDASGATTAYQYDEDGLLVSETNELGARTSYTHNTDGTLAAMTDPFGHVTTYGYDARGNLTTTTRPDGATETRTYDDAGRLTSITGFDQNSSSYAYDADGNLATITRRDGTVTTFGYDAMGRLVSMADENGQISTLAYDERGNVSSSTDESGAVSSFEYDADGRLSASIDASGGRSTRTYDGAGRVTAVIDPLGGTTSLGYDASGRLISLTTATGAMCTATYDDMGRTTSMVDFSGETTTYTYDALGRLAGIDAPGAGGVTYTRDALGSITELVDPVGVAWSFTYDQDGRLTSWEEPGGQSTSVTYDNLGRPTSYTLPGGLGTATVAYDANSNIVQQDYSDGTSLSFTYDELGRMVSGTNFSFTRDAVGRIVDSNGIGATLDPAGRVTTLTYPAGDVSYTYDAAGRVVQVDDWLGNSTTFEYDAAGRRTLVARPNGVDTSISYDADGAITGVQSAMGATALSSITLERDTAGNVVGGSRDLPTLPTIPNAETFTASSGGQLGQATYDALGRLTSDGTRTYTWDLASRLTGYDAVTFEYDALLRVTDRTDGGTTTHYVWNYATGEPSIAVTAEGGSDTAYFVFTPAGELLYRIDATTDAVSHYHFDEMGNTLYLTDEQGAVTDTYAYTAYGVLTASSGTTPNPFTYQGRLSVVQQGDSGLYTMGRRFYDSASQRFISPEPVRKYDHPRYLNLYAYALGNPLRFVDPSGEEPGSVTQDVKNKISAGKPVVSAATHVMNDTGDVADSLVGLSQKHIDLSAETVDGLKSVSAKAKNVSKALGKLSDASTLTDALIAGAEDGPGAALAKVAPDAVGKIATAGTEKLLTKNGVNKQLAKASGRRTGGALKKVVGVGIAAYEMNEKVKEGMAELRKGLRSDLANYYLITDLIWEAYRRKLIDVEELERRLIEAKETFEMTSEGTHKAKVSNVKIALLEGLKSMLESLL